MAFQLLHDRVAVIADEIAETTASGLIVAESAQSPLRYGIVASVGLGNRSDRTNSHTSLDVSEGDRVFFHRSSGQPLEIDGVSYVILLNAEIIGVDTTSA